MADAHRLYVGNFEQLRNNFDLGGATFGETFIWDLTGPNPTDEDCRFCDEPQEKFRVNAFAIAVPLAEGRVALKGALGMMRPGYMLGVTSEHLTSYAQLPRSDLSAIDTAFTNVERQLCRDLRYDGYVRVEHGSDNTSSCGLGAGACIVHAHQHFIPETGNTASLMLSQDLGWKELKTYEDLSAFKGEPYLYVGHDGQHAVVANPEIPSQWGRRLIAEEDGHNEWDWAVFSGANNLIQTLLSLDMLPQGRFYITHDGLALYERRPKIPAADLHIGGEAEVRSELGIAPPRSIA